ncbi:MAG: valine--tRNA ligase [Proteobacteria bacterium]|nr:valine--tRNA ligase [Pseudomonadota bacterium]
MSSEMLDKGYEPRDVEKKWFDFWEKENLFGALDESPKKSYSIVIPPPNVTGVLHMGHALNNTLQDILCRYRRLRGDNVLWMPGTDHAGIATQNVVEKDLTAKGISRHELGREKFIEAVWEWKEKSGSAIINQLKSMGASCDFRRERFTMDEGLSKAVREVFVKLYKDGLIYRANYIINWCPRCNTALADLEVDHETSDGHLYHIKYPFTDDSGGLIVATTRPETMFGDTAVAVHPDDERYKNLSADHVKLPLTDKTIPIIRDTYVETGFGTGALKVTPAHDPNDFHIGERHNLDSVKVIDDNGIMTDGAGKYIGLDRFECRKAAVKDLEEQGLLVKIEPHSHSVGHCYRCKTVVEPNLSKQWFVNVKPLAEKAIKAVEEGTTKIIPDHWKKTYFEWMYNIKDWCISRQIWWGHRIPVWTCEDCSDVIVEVETPASCPSCSGKNLLQETDVLDTWFSSALWPFSTMGWPEETKLLNTFYPTSVLVTGFDILFFWVARMMMMGIHFMGEVPFKDVYIHALVRDEHGKKMSKSKGNVIDPLTVIDSHGTDAFRFTLAAFAAQGRDIKLSMDRVEGYRNFINKLWNAARFSFMHLDKEMTTIDWDHISVVDKWILSRLKTVSQTVVHTLEDYKFNETAGALYNFVWHEFCDWYLEASKPALYDKMGEKQKEASKSVLWRVLHDTLILLHPFVPFVTEEIWHKLPGSKGAIMQAVYPEDNDSLPEITVDPDAEATMNLMMALISAIRNIRGEMQIAPSAMLKVIVQSGDQHIREKISHHGNLIKNLARLDAFDISIPGKRPKSSATAIIEGAQIYVSLEGVVDLDKERTRLEKEIGKVEKELTGVDNKLNNDSFISKAPDQVVLKVRDQQKGLIEKHDKLKINLQKIMELVSSSDET